MQTYGGGGLAPHVPNLNSAQLITKIFYTRGDVSLLLYVCGNSTANGPFVQPPHDTRVNMKQWWNDIDMENRRTQLKHMIMLTLTAEVIL